MFRNLTLLRRSREVWKTGYLYDSCVLVLSFAAVSQIAAQWQCSARSYELPVSYLGEILSGVQHMDDSHLVMPLPPHKVLVWRMHLWVERRCKGVVLHWHSWAGQAVIRLPTPLHFTVGDFKWASILSWGGKAETIPLAWENIATGVCQERRETFWGRAATLMHVDFIKQSGLSLLFVSTGWEQRQIGLERAPHRDIQNTYRIGHFNGYTGSLFFDIITGID